MEAAYRDGYEWVWMMDDDGMPAENGLEQLLIGAAKYSLDYANALVISIKDRYSLSFGLIEGKTTIDDFKGMEFVPNKANPFNGTLVNRRIPEKVGFIKKEMFIWGDEVEYCLRAIKHGFSVGTVVKSIHYHPQKKAIGEPIIPFFKRPRVALLAAQYSHRNPIYYRNRGYIAYKHRGKLNVCKAFAGYSVYFLLRFRFSELKIFAKSFINGCRNKFDKQQ
jgi:rhamnopyranosyl-N-acetylglucosaminyl-diphospho-decaprenol beta-1,3/1,4-galactofuranosyltransferase